MAPILGALFAILVGLLSVPSLISWQNQAKNNVNAATIAQQARQIVVASSQYIQTNATTLQATASASTPIAVSVAQLQTAGVLPGAFKETNLYNQTWQLQVLQPTPGNLQGLAITTGGEAISDTRAMQVAKLIGYEGGFFPKNDTGLYPGGASNAHGASWGPLSAAGYTNEAGHIALLISFNSGQLTDNRLYRNAVPGQPQLNTMTTPLIMASVQTVGDACATPAAIAADSKGAVLSCQEDTWKKQGSAFWQDPASNVASLPTCNAEAAWQTRVVQTPTTGSGPRAYTCNGTTWQALAVHDSGSITISGTATIAKLSGNLEITKTATEGTACSPDRSLAMSATTSGLLLSCQSGVWRQPGWLVRSGPWAVVRWGATNGAGASAIGMGKHYFCWLSSVYGGLSSGGGGAEGSCSVTPDANNNWSIIARVQTGSWVASCEAYCLD